MSTKKESLVRFVTIAIVVFVIAAIVDRVSR